MPPPPTVGQFGPLGCRINSTSTFVIFCIRVDVSRVTSGYGGDMTPLSQVRLTPKNGLGSAGRFLAPIGQSHHWQGQKCFLAESHFFKTFIQINFIFVVSNGQSDIASFCRIFRAFWQINSTASWPTVPPPPFEKVFLKILHFFKWWLPLLTTWNQEMLAHLKKGPFSSNFGEHLKHTEIFYGLKRGPKLANINTKIQVNFPYYY